MQKTTILFLFAIAVSFSSLSQQRNPKTLLWRISGKGLTKPSYLFGTMHLSDKRLFHFTDSTYAAIEVTDGFAMEINPDEYAAYILNDMFSAKSSKRILQNILNPDQFKKYGEPLAKKIGKPAGEITADDIVREKNKWMDEYLAKGEMPTFVDAYLYNIAKKQGKWVGGIEDIQDQAGLEQDLLDVTDIEVMVSQSPDSKTIEKSYSDFVNVYSNEDLDAIENISGAGNHRDEVLIRRNFKMARRMDSLSAIRSMFFAIGAAHLPGDSGVIALLKRSGFTVEPVLSNRKIEPSAYTFKEVEKPWIEVSDSSGYYTVSMPSNPVSVKMFGIMEMKFLLDISTNSAYCTMAAVNPGASGNRDSLINAIAKSMSQNQKLPPGKSLLKNGVPGKEFMIEASTFKARIQVFAKDNIVYILMKYGLNKAAAVSAETDKFFNSFKPAAISINTNDVTLHPFNVTGIPVTFKTPANLAYAEQLSKSEVPGWDIATFTASDVNTGSFFLFLERKIQKGYHMVSDSASINEIKQGLYTRISEIISEKNIPVKNGTAYILKGRSNQQKGLALTTMLVSRDQSLYMFSAVYTEGRPIPAVDSFFASVELLPYAPSSWQLHTSIDSTFTTWSPGPFSWNYSTDSSSRQIMSFDEKSATTLLVYTDTLSRYFWTESDSAFWKDRISRYNTLEDSVINVIDVKNDDVAGKEVWVNTKGSTTLKRVRLFRNGTVVYHLLAYGSKAHMESALYNRFFNDFRFTRPVQQSDITASKASELLSDLSTADSATRAAAFTALSTAKFSKKELPLLFGALYSNYPLVWQNASSDYVNREIADKIVQVNDTSTVRFVSGGYQSLSVDEHRWIALTILADTKTSVSYAELKRLLTEYPIPKGGINYRFRYALTDSLLLTAGIYRDLFHLVPDTSISLIIAAVGMDLLDSNILLKKDLLPYEQKFIALSNLYFERTRNSTNDEYDYELHSLVKLLAAFATPSSYTALRKFLGVKAGYLKKDAALLLLRNKQTLDPKVIASLAADRSVRSGLYDELKEIGKQSLFPLQFATQKAFAESDAWVIASDDDSPSSLTAAGERIALHKGRKYKFYLFKVTFNYEGESTSYLMVAGGYDIAGKQLKPVKDLTSLYFEEEYDTNALTRLFNAWLEQFKEEVKEEAFIK